MSINWPESNLPDEAQEWRRKVEEIASGVAREGQILRTNSKASSQERNALRRAVNNANLDLQDQRDQLADGARTPAAPADPIASSDAYFDEYGYPRATVFASSAPVTLDTNGEAINVSRYELFGRPNVAGESWVHIAEELRTSGTPQLRTSGLPAGTEWAFKTRAVSDRGSLGEFSAEVVLMLAKDTTPPPKPAPLTGTSRLGQNILSWSGLTAGGGSQPADFSHGEVGIATSAAGAGTIVGRIAGSKDTFVAPEVPYNAERWYYVIAVDYAGNRSAPSDRVSLTTKPLVDTDIIGRVLDGANIKLLSIQGDLIAANALTEDKLAVNVRGKIDKAVADVATAQTAADQAKADATAAGNAAASASTAAGNALTAAQNADGKATNAGTAAAQATSDALAAKGAADTAKTTADTANAAALAASGIANSKGKVLTQTAAPAVADRNDATLWIDITGGANTPKRWNGNAWVAVTDKAATDAATAAANAATAAATADGKAVAAQTAANNAAQAASAAQGTANTAVTNAATAQSRADTAKSAADAAQLNADSLKARGTDLITNGNAKLGALNFSQFTLETGDQPTGAAGAFSAGTANNVARILDDFVPIDPSKAILASISVKQANPGVASRTYFGLQPYDIDGLAISPPHYAERAGTRTVLAAPLNPGDTTVKLASTANWQDGSVPTASYLAVWNYVDSRGKKWGAGEYTRQLVIYPSGGISGNIVTLPAPWALPAAPAGTPVSNNTAGGTYMYAPGISFSPVPNISGEWTTLTATAPYQGVHSGADGVASLAFPAATAQAKVAILTNYGVTGGTSKQLFANVSLSEANAAQLRATEARTAADAAAAAAAAAQTAAGNAQTTANQAQETASGKSKTYRALTVPSGVGTALEDTWEQWSSLGTGGKLLAFWRWGGAGPGWVKGTLDETYLPLVNIGAGTYGSLNGDRMTANTIAVEKLLVADFQNYFNDPTFANPAGYAPWTSVNGALEKNGTGAQNGAYHATTSFPVKAGERYRFTVTRENVVGSAGTARVNLSIDGVGAVVLMDLPTAGTFTVEREIPASASAAMRVGLFTLADMPAATRVRIRDVQIRRMTAGELIVDGAVSADKIAADAVTAAKILAGSVTAVKIAADAVTADKILANSVTAGKINANAVTAREILAGTITATEIATDAITAVKILANSITTAKIATGAVTANEILANTITGDKLVINSITSREIAALTITAGQLAANAITTDKLDAGAVTAVKIDALAVTAAKIAANAVTADKIVANAVTGEKISATAIDGKTITGALIRSSAGGARTEMNSSGLRVVNAANQDLVQVGYGIATGLGVRNPSTGAIVPLAPHVFGTVAGAKTNLITFAPTNAWSAYVDEFISPTPVSTPTGRLAVHWAVGSNLWSVFNFQAELVIDLMHGNLNTSAYTRIVNSEDMGGSAAGFAVVDVPAGADRWLRMSFRAWGSTPGSNLTLYRRSMMATPI